MATAMKSKPKYTLAQIRNAALRMGAKITKTRQGERVEFLSTRTYELKQVTPTILDEEQAYYRQTMQDGVTLDTSCSQLPPEELKQTYAEKKNHYSEVWRMRQLLAADLTKLDAALERLAWEVDHREAHKACMNFQRHAADLNRLVLPRVLSVPVTVSREKARSA